MGGKQCEEYGRHTTVTFQDAVDLIKREREVQERQYGPRNRALEFLEWVGIFGQRLGYMIQAAASKQRPWFAEECVKTAATCVAALESLPEVDGMSLDADGLAEVVGVEGSRSRIVAKVSNAPPTAIRVAQDARRVWLGNGGVWVSKE